MNNIIKTIATETADTLTPAQRLTVNTGYSSQCGTCETEIYLTRAEWDAIWDNGGEDVPCPDSTTTRPRKAALQLHFRSGGH